MCPPTPFSLSASCVEIGTIYEGKRHVAKEGGNGGGSVHLVEVCGECDCSRSWGLRSQRVWRQICQQSVSLTNFSCKLRDVHKR